MTPSEALMGIDPIRQVHHLPDIPYHCFDSDKSENMLYIPDEAHLMGRDYLDELRRAMEDKKVRQHLKFDITDRRDTYPRIPAGTLVMEQREHPRQEKIQVPLG
ncbi:hypothetical protein MGG_13904 [Pyricularia oryzae 70-15]|uniref:Uncharacterized protein n=1 Tax=Pyricularia oryzae (strain 70-15 / ATCC MYA-4617 / FGSC 8958) TaxID=242507 RepID=G4N2D6_PYRO7|nr:uncharacterized protein MGG_13904 [Pyricularia oryzae 70-15]EHA53341.1 hypothetical protein MGG_13904 [Pyricularia oryzae 70-15]